MKIFRSKVYRGPTREEQKVFRDFAATITDHAKRIGTYPEGLKKTDKSVDGDHKKEYTGSTGDEKRVK